MSARPCEAIVAYFVFGPQRCLKTSVAEVVDETWGSIHPVCAEHAPTTTTHAEDTEATTKETDRG